VTAGSADTKAERFRAAVEEVLLRDFNSKPGRMVDVLRTELVGNESEPAVLVVWRDRDSGAVDSLDWPLGDDLQLGGPHAFAVMVYVNLEEWKCRSEPDDAPVMMREVADRLRAVDAAGMTDADRTRLCEALQLARMSTTDVRLTTDEWSECQRVLISSNRDAAMAYRVAAPLAPEPLRGVVERLARRHELSAELALECESASDHVRRLADDPESGFLGPQTDPRTLEEFVARFC
jgi:hypothetical protein